MPGKADRLKKENEELRKELAEAIASDRQEIDRLHRKIRELTPKDRITVVGPFFSDPAETVEEMKRRLEKDQDQLQVKDKLDELAQRVDQLAAAYDAWDLMRDNTSARLTGVEVAQRDLFSRMARLERTEEPLPERRWWWK